MKTSLFVALLFNLAVSFTVVAEDQNDKILIVLGGKKIDTASLLETFKSYSNIEFDTISKPSAFNLFGSYKIKNYSAIIFYDTYQPISDVEKKSFLNIFEQGIGCVFLHHSLVSHQEWDEYEKILGGKYFHTTYADEGKKYGPSTYKHDQDFTVIVVDSNHPVTKGVANFTIRDEAYLNFKIGKDIVPLLTTDNCENGKYIGWTKTYNKSKLVYLQLGHDNQAYSNEGFRKLLINSIHWVSR